MKTFRVMVGNPETDLVILCADVGAESFMFAAQTTGFELAKYAEEGEKEGLALPNLGPLTNVRLYISSADPEVVIQGVDPGDPE